MRCALASGEARPFFGMCLGPDKSVTSPGCLGEPSEAPEEATGSTQEAPRSPRQPQAPWGRPRKPQEAPGSLRKHQRSLRTHGCMAPPPAARRRGSPAAPPPPPRACDWTLPVPRHFLGRVCPIVGDGMRFVVQDCGDGSRRCRPLRYVQRRGIHARMPGRSDSNLGVPSLMITFSSRFASIQVLARSEVTRSYMEPRMSRTWKLGRSLRAL